MYTELIKDKLFEQSEVYRALKRGETASVQYSGYKDEKWGTRDANYLNRMRLAYYLLYGRIDDEDAIVYLFQEELKDRTKTIQSVLDYIEENLKAELSVSDLSDMTGYSLYHFYRLFQSAVL